MMRPACSPFGARLVLAIAVLIATARSADAAPKTDIIELRNGDRLTCEIRKLDRGKLTVKTDGIGTISIEWDDIERVTSTASYDVELSTGERYFGSLGRGDSGSVDIVSAASTERIPLASIVRMMPLGGTFWGRLDGSIDAGFSFTEANLQTQWTFDSTVNYRGRNWLTQLDADSALTTREDADRQSRNALTLQTERFIGRHWSAVSFGQLQQNEELSLSHRTVLGLGARRIFLRSNRAEVSSVAAVAYTQEKYVDVESDNVAEAVAGVNLDWFTFDGRSFNLDVTATSFFALTRSRVRLELNASFKSDIVGDLYWSVNVFDSFNSEPPADQKANDFGVSAALGWSF